MLACAAPRFDCLRDGQAAVRGRARARRQGRRRARSRRPPRRAAWRWPGRARGSARPCSASRRRACPGRRATARRSCGSPRRARRGRGPRGGGAGGRAVSGRRAQRDRPHAPRGPSDDRGRARRTLSEAAAERRRRAALRPRRRPRKHGLEPAAGLDRSTRRVDDDVDLCIVLGGDGTILHGAARATPARACRCSRSTSARSASSRRSSPTSVHDGFEPRVRRRLRGACDLPAIVVDGARTARWTRDQRRLLPPQARPARRRPRLRASASEEIGRVRCDGLVVATPAGLDGLQPRQRRPGAGLGRGGLRRLVHRAALADGARARRRARATC